MVTFVSAVNSSHLGALTLATYAHLLDGDIGKPLELGPRTGPDLL